MKLNLNLKKIAPSAVALTVLTGSNFAMAASGTGGVDAALDTAKAIQTAAFSLLAVLGTLYLIYLAVLAFTEKKSWADFGWGVVHVALAGAAVALSTWAWTLFSA
jgi:hypothetical protein